MEWLRKLLGLETDPFLRQWNKKAKEQAKKRKTCKHNQNYSNEQYKDFEGTPMIRFVCHDCGMGDRGHVHGDPNSWEVFSEEFRNGVLVSRTPPVNTK
jgi:hypothetical protein